MLMCLSLTIVHFLKELKMSYDVFEKCSFATTKCAYEKM